MDVSDLLDRKNAIRRLSDSDAPTTNFESIFQAPKKPNSGRLRSEKAETAFSEFTLIFVYFVVKSLLFFY